MIGAAHGAALARFARACLRHELGGRPAAPLDGAWAAAPGATFVSLHWPDGELQGCIGTLAARRGLADDVAGNAVAAGLDDPRGRRLTLDDVERLEVEVSILSPMERVPAASEAEALRAIRPGIDGLMLEHRGQRGTLLPSVWPQLPEPAAFLAMLRRKARLPPDFWADDVVLWRYTTEVAVDPAPEPR